MELCQNSKNRAFPIFILFICCHKYSFFAHYLLLLSFTKNLVVVDNFVSSFLLFLSCTALQDRFLDQWKEEEHLCDIFMLTQRSVNDEIGRLLEVDSMLFAIAILMIVSVLSVFFHRSSLVESKALLGFGGAMIIILQAVMFAFGVQGHLGIDVNSICFLIPFIVAGVGVDDMIVIEGFYQTSIDDGNAVGERMQSALKEAVSNTC